MRARWARWARWAPERWRRRAEDRQVAAELPDLLDSLAADLRSGGTLAGALARAADGPGPLAGEVAVLARGARDGRLADALACWPQRRPRPEVAAAAAAMEVAAQAGGGAADALGALAGGLRDGADVAAEARALSAQARLSALVVALAPIGSLVFAQLCDPRVPRTLVATAAGRLFLLAGAALEAAAGWWMRVILSGPTGARTGLLRHERRRPSGRRARRSRGPVPESDVALAADLLALGLGAGLTPALAIEVAGRAAPATVAVRLGGVRRAVETGRSPTLADALDDAARAQPELRALFDILGASERLGAPATDGLRRLAAQCRARARRAALTRARTLPVRLLFPLVFCVLPAFVLLAVGPVILAGLRQSP